VYLVLDAPLLVLEELKNRIVQTMWAFTGRKKKKERKKGPQPCTQHTREHNKLKFKKAKKNKKTISCCRSFLCKRCTHFPASFKPRYVDGMLQR
jgi:hypothetical protein